MLEADLTPQQQIDQAMEQAYQLFYDARYDEMERLVGLALGVYAAAGAAAVPPHSLAAVKMVQAFISSENGLPGDSLAFCLEALLLLNADDDAKIRARTLNVLSAVHYATLQFAPAVDYARQGLELCEEADLPEESVPILHTITGLLAELHDYRRSLEYSRQSLALSEKHGLEIQKIYSLFNRGVALQIMGRLEQSERCFREALAANQSVRNQLMEGFSRAALGVMAFLQGRYAEARDGLLLGIEALSGLRVGMRNSSYYNVLGATYLALGELELAKAALDRALQIAETYDYIFTQDTIYSFYTEYYLAVGDFEKAFLAQRKVRALEKFQKLQISRHSFTTLPLKHPIRVGRGMESSELALKNALTTEPSSGFLSSLSFMSLGNRYFKQFSGSLPDCQLLIFSITGGLDQRSLEPVDVPADTLQAIIDGLGEFIRLSDMVSRLPGGYFLALLPQTSAEEAQEIIDQILDYFKSEEDEAFVLQYLDLQVHRSQPSPADISFSHFVNRSLLQIL